MPLAKDSLKCVEINHSCWQNRNMDNLSTLVSHEPVNWVEQGMVLGSGCHDHLSLWVLSSCPIDSLDCLIVGFRAAGREDDFASIRTKCFCDLVSGIFQDGSGVLPVGVD